MTDDPREVLKAAGVECAEAEKVGMSRGWYDAKASHQHALNIIEIDDAAILALARLAAKYKSAYEAERGHVLRGPTGTEWIRRDLAEEEIAKHKPK